VKNRRISYERSSSLEREARFYMSAAAPRPTRKQKAPDEMLLNSDHAHTVWAIGYSNAA
jgi:hypothetical protein